MTPLDSAFLAVLSQYPAQAQPVSGSVEFLGSAGGFSGAQFWRFQSPAGRLCLRRWPVEHPNLERLQFIHAVLAHVHQRGFRLIPVPLPTQSGGTYVQHAGHLWELTPWMAGQADYHNRPALQKLEAALRALAAFHQAAASFPLTSREPTVSPGIRQRLEQLHELRRGGLEQLRSRIEPGVWPALAERGHELLRHFERAASRVASELEQAAVQPTRLVPCLRDVWHDHVLFEGNEVTALVDFGAMRPECVAADVARLLGSLAGNDSDAWAAGLAAYSSVYPLSVDERHLVQVFDHSGVLLGGINWLRWVFVEGRTFEARDAILKRIDGFLERLTYLTSGGSALVSRF